jgi:1,4-alpha-glucan branching enzyme
MGSEFGQWAEWDEARSLDWHQAPHWPHSGLQRLVADLHRVYRREPALHQVDFDWHGFEWLQARDNENCVFAFLRRAANPADCLVFVGNFTPVPRHGYRVGVPIGGRWREVLNSDSALYGGSDLGNAGELWALDEPWSGQPKSLCLTVPPLGGLYLKPS